MVEPDSGLPALVVARLPPFRRPRSASLVRALSTSSALMSATSRSPRASVQKARRERVAQSNSFEATNASTTTLNSAIFGSPVTAVDHNPFRGLLVAVVAQFQAST